MTHQPVAFKALMIIYSFGALSPILFYQAPGDFLCRFTNTAVKTAIRILNTWSLEARNRIAHHAKAKRYPN